MVRPWPYKIGSSLLGVAVAFLLAEGAIRMLWWLEAQAALEKMTQASAPETIDTKGGQLAEGVRRSVFPDVVYELRPNVHGVYDGRRYVSDRYGFREDRPIEVQKPLGVSRVLGIGDSWMWGSGVNNGETYLDVLSDTFHAEGFSTEIINSGVWGYNVTQQLATLSHKGLQFSPDIVVIGLCGNDREYPTFMRTESYLGASGSALVRVVSRALRKPDADLEAAHDHSLMPFSDFFAAYRELHSHAARNGFRVVVFSECLRDPPTRKPEEQTTWSRWCQELGTPDEYRKFVATAQNEWGFTLCDWNADDVPQNGPPWGHASPEGNRVLANRLAECLRPLLIEPVALDKVQLRLNRNGNDARLFHDGSLKTRWDSGATQTGEEEIIIDAGSPISVRRIVLSLGEWTYDYGRELSVDLATEEGQYTEVVHIRGDRLLQADAVGPERLQVIPIPPSPPARLIRIRQLGRTDDNFWSIAELEIWKSR